MNWIRGVKHAITSVTIFKNVWEWDRLRATTAGRCEVCDIVISENESEVKRVIFKCKEDRCNCQKPYTVSGLRSHKLCEVCKDMYESLYVNYLMDDTNYFKKLDDKEGI